MAVFVPFKGVRYDADDNTLAELVCPPYDIISSTEFALLRGNNPDNIVTVELPVGGDNRYEKSAGYLRDMMNEGTLKRDEKAMYYIYQMEYPDPSASAGKKHRKMLSVEGIVGRCFLEPFENGVVLPHENTLSKAKEDRLKLLEASRANISSVYSLFNDEQGEILKLIKKLMKQIKPQSVKYGEETHRIYPVSDDESIELIRKTFTDKKLYIADGHHRYETGLNYKKQLIESGVNVTDEDPESYIMMTCVPLEHPGLTVLPTHRIIKGQDPYFPYERFFNQCRDYFDIVVVDTETAQGYLDACHKNGKCAFVMYTGGKGRRKMNIFGIDRNKVFDPNANIFLMVLRDRSILDSAIDEGGHAYKNLDVTILHKLILENILGIDKQDMAAGKSLTYTRDTTEAIDYVDAGEADFAFLLNPTTVKEISDVAAEGDRMPQKSTYFYPKLITGLVINVMEERE